MGFNLPSAVRRLCALLPAPADAVGVRGPHGARAFGAHVLLVRATTGCDIGVLFQAHGGLPEPGRQPVDAAGFHAGAARPSG